MEKAAEQQHQVIRNWKSHPTRPMLLNHRVQLYLCGYSKLMVMLQT